MAEEEPILTNPPTHEVARHVDDYSRFITMLKVGMVGAVIAGIIALIAIT